MLHGSDSKNGIGTVLLVNRSGPANVIEVHVSSSYCNTCETQHHRLSNAEYIITFILLSIADFDIWHETHKCQCEKNHEGSAGAMEPQSMLQIYRRSEEKHQLV